MHKYSNNEAGHQSTHSLKMILSGQMESRKDSLPRRNRKDAEKKQIRGNAPGNGLDPAETIMIGDREIDGKSGKNAGIAGALLSYDMTGFEVAAAASYIHGRAGDKALEKSGRYSLVASDIAAALPEVIY